MKGIFPSEEDECKAFVEYLDLKGYTYSHIRQEVYTKSWNQKRKNKALGVKKGVPDYMVIKDDQLIFIEMKRCKKSLSTVGPEQKEWNLELNKCQGVTAYICYGALEAINMLEKYH